MGPEKFNELWSRRNEYDFLVGIRDGRIQALPRKIISFVSRLCVRLFYGKSVWDVNTPYRLMRASAFKDFYAQIPLTTFAPNVILSGLAARHKLRCFETNVPQHDRVTGEVSIKKWKLLKAAARSFWQTIAFSVNAEIVVPILFSALFCCLNIFLLDYITHPLYDECGTADTAANVVLRGVWESHVWPYSYNPLHIFLLEIWLRIWGVTHTSVCGFGVFTAFVLSLILRRILSSFGVLSDVLTNIVFVVLFWGGWQFSEIIMLGRIDMIAALFTVLTVAELMRNDDATIFKWKICLFSFLMMLSAVYQVPLVVLFLMLQFAMADDKSMRKVVWRKGLACAVGVFSAFLCSCLYYAYHHSLLRFIHTYFSFNATLSGSAETVVDKIMHSYSHDIMALSIFALIVVFILVYPRLHKNIKWQYLLFVGLIPPLAKFCGRYEAYYSWMFYLPVIVFFIWSLNLFRATRTLRLTILGVLIVVMCIHVYGRTLVERRFKFIYEDARNQVDEISGELYSGKDVVISDLAYYYPLLRYRAKVWYQRSLTKSQQSDSRYTLTPRQKFERLMSKIWKTRQSQEKLMDLFDRVEQSYEVQPPEDAISLPLKAKSTIRHCMSK